MATTNDQKHFFQEIQSQYSLKHETILPLIGFAIPKKDNDKYAIITDYMPNRSLNELIKLASSGSTPNNWETIKAINIFGIAAGMAYIHQHNIIHCSLNPEHVFLDENYHPKIGGFEYSKIGQLENKAKNISSQFYMAPEFLKGSNCSQKVDVYSYAVTLYKLLTLKDPFYEKTEHASYILLFVGDGMRPLIKQGDMPELYFELLNYCWDNDPEQRPSFIKIVNGFLDHQEDYFNMDLIDKEEFENYINEVINDLDFSPYYKEEEETND